MHAKLLSVASVRPELMVTPLRQRSVVVGVSESDVVVVVVVVVGAARLMIKFAAEASPF
jgi:hypothetical protein